ncbi:MAG: glycerol acyltransferase [Deltaproteobacteria bacterium]|nr:glycerol acyltransferase [Deltaproteobacteria bacterium]
MQYTFFDIPILRNLLQVFCIITLKIIGWRREGQLPDVPKFVLVAAPHTSNWDFPIGMAVMLAFKMNLHWLGKNSLFRWPFGIFLKWLGGIPVNRAKSGDVVAQIVQSFKEKTRLIMVVAPEGTRKKVAHWKTGFYYIAKGANVPIALGFLDYVRKVGGFGPTFMPSGNIEHDMQKIRDFYDSITGKCPDRSSPATISPTSL